MLYSWSISKTDTDRLTVLFSCILSLNLKKCLPLCNHAVLKNGMIPHVFFTPLASIYYLFTLLSVQLRLSSVHFPYLTCPIKHIM